MPKLTQTVEIEQTIELSTKQQLTLRKALQNYQRIQQKIKSLKDEAAKCVSDVEDIMAETNVEELQFEGFKSKIVAGVRKQFDKQKFVLKGGNLAVYNESMSEVPVKAYVRISAPGADGDDE